MKAPITIDTAVLTTVCGGRSIWDRVVNLGKATVNGVYNALPDQITGVGARGADVQGQWNKSSLGGKPFKDDPLSKFRNER
jgi:hypothetical protein